MAIAFPDSILVTTNKPLDAKSAFETIAERNALPVSLRYKGLLCSVSNAIGQPVTFWCLNTDDLTNSGWTEVPLGGSMVITISDWQPNVVYVQNQPVVFSGRLYRSNTNHTSSASFDDDENMWDAIGGESQSYIHEQVAEADTWLCQHNLGSTGVSVVVIDSSGSEVFGFVDRATSTSNLLVIRFDVPISGSAYIKS